MKKVKRICLIPFAKNVGGPASFQRRFAAVLEERGIQITYHLDDNPYDAVLVVGGTRHLGGLWSARRRGIPIIQRLNGMNWLHRKLKTGVLHYLKAEYGNLLLSFIRRRLATSIVYQSHFAQSWWERVHGYKQVPSQVTHNGVDLEIFSPEGPHNRPENIYRLLLVEGRMGGGYEVGLRNAVKLTESLSNVHNLPVELIVAGRVSENVKTYWENESSTKIHWSGLVPGNKIPELDRSAHLLYSADLNPACPNSVIEALACGLPVVSLDTGSLPELVVGDAGRIVPYGGDPWQLDPPDIASLAAACVEVLQNQDHFRPAARTHATAEFCIDKMVEEYLKALTANG